MKADAGGCPDCKGHFRTDFIPMTFKINPNIIVQDVKVHVCIKCGFESVTEDEYEVVRKRVHEIAKIGKESLVVTKVHSN